MSTTPRSQDKQAQEARMWIELTPEEQEAARTAFKVAHKVVPDFEFAPDRAWLEGYSFAALSQGKRQSEQRGSNE